MGLGLGLGLAAPGIAAEEIVFSLGAFGRSVEVSSIEAFAESGTVSQDLSPLLRAVNTAKQQLFREALGTPIDLDPNVVSRVANSELGGTLFGLIGELITTPTGLNGGEALRSAITQAALEEDGFTLFNILKLYPTDIRIDMVKALRAVRSAQKVADTSVAMLGEVKQLAQAEAAADPLDFGELPDQRLEGSQPVSLEAWKLEDSDRSRSFFVNIYRPEAPLAPSTPVIVISHGLNASPESWDAGARFFASHGYVVAVPQHPGSDNLQTERFLQGSEDAVFSVQEFIDRPLDIHQVLDELEQRNASEFEGQLSLENVGVFGHSLGGYTALALGGATLNFEALEDACKAQNYLNISLLLQCRGLQLPRQTYDLKDDRVGAVVSLNPVNSAIFGEEGLNQVAVPVMVGAGSHDPATPFVYEQLRSFPWIGEDNDIEKYLVLLEGQAHVDLTQLDAGIGKLIESIRVVTLPTRNVVEGYGRPLGLAFFNTYLRGQEGERIYLEPGYAQFLSQGEEFPAALITQRSAQSLSRILAEYEVE